MIGVDDGRTRRQSSAMSGRSVRSGFVSEVSWILGFTILKIEASDPHLNRSSFLSRCVLGWSKVLR